MSLYIDSVDLEHGNPDSRYELLASAAVADLGDSVGAPRLDVDNIQVSSDILGHARKNNGFDYGFFIVEALTPEEVIKTSLLQRIPTYGNLTTIARSGRIGKGPVEVVTHSITRSFRTLASIDLISNDEEFVSKVRANSIKIVDVRRYDADFEARVVELVREHALLKEEITV